MTAKPKTHKVSAAKAKATADNLAVATADVEAASEEAKTRSDCDNFIALFAGWHRARADIDQPREDSTDEEDDARTNRAENLARLITTTPASKSWMVWQKFEVLEHYLNFYGEGTTWSDARELVMLTGIKADQRGARGSARSLRLLLEPSRCILRPGLTHDHPRPHQASLRRPEAQRALLALAALARREALTVRGAVSSRRKTTRAVIARTIIDGTTHMREPPLFAMASRRRG